MKQLLDFLPIVLFFIAYQFGDIYMATGVIMAATVVQMAILYKLDGKLETLHKVTLALVVGFGAMTLAFHDERFIKIKPTVLYTAMGLTLAIGLWGFGKNFLRMMLGKAMTLPEPVWRNLTMAWVLYTFFMAALNAYIAYSYSTEFWVSFKLWGYAFPLVFLLGQGLYVAKYMQEPEAVDAANAGTGKTDGGAP